MVDRANDGEARATKTPQEFDDAERALRVESRRRLVAEQDRRATDDLDGDGQALALLGVQPGARRANDCVLQVGQVEQVEDRVDVGEFLGARHRRVVAQERRKL